MFILYGFRTIRSRRSSSEASFCAGCQRDVRWNIHSERSWFALFFLPVLPIGEASYVVECPRCGYINHRYRDPSDDDDEQIAKLDEGDADRRAQALDRLSRYENPSRKKRARRHRDA